jgi:succinoglycan biosynthesis protein ExoA
MTAPSVSVLLPTLNEQRYVQRCIESLLEQDYAHIVEILVVDGGSRDGTGKIVGAFGPPTRMLTNPRVTTASALNIGLLEARGDVVVRADAHTHYAPDYVRRCIEVLRETGVDGVGGLMRPRGKTPFGRAVAAVTSSPIGVGPGKFHYAMTREEVDTVYLGCWHRETLESLGGWDEQLLYAEDDELNFRLRASGGRIILDPSIRSWYFPRETPHALWNQYLNYGLGKARSLAKHGTLPTWRPLAPAALVAGSVSLLIVGRGYMRLMLPAIHTFAAVSAAIGIGSRREADALPAFAAIEICHWAYGIGFWRGLVRIAGGRPI